MLPFPDLPISWGTAAANVYQCSTIDRAMCQGSIRIDKSQVAVIDLLFGKVNQAPGASRLFALPHGHWCMVTAPQ